LIYEAIAARLAPTITIAANRRSLEARPPSQRSAMRYARREMARKAPGMLE